MKRLFIEFTIVASAIGLIVLLFFPRNDLDRIETWIDQQPVSACVCSGGDVQTSKLVGRWRTDGGT